MEKKTYFILLRDLEDPSSRVAGMLWGMLSNYVYGTQPPLALKGELFEALPADEQPAGIDDKVAVRGLKQKYLQVECPKENLQIISDKDAYLLLAVQSYHERCRIFDDKKDLLRWGVTDNEGCQVSVWMDDLKKDVTAVVHYKGALPPYDGIMFGVEIVVCLICSLLQGGTYVQDFMHVLFNKYLIFDTVICHFHIASYVTELCVFL